MEETKAPERPAPEIEKQPLIKPALSFLSSHVGGLFMAALLCLALSGLMTGVGLYLCIPLTLLVYGIPVYGTMWSMGMSDMNKANFGHIVLDRWRGAKLAAIGLSPWILCSVLFLLSKFGLFYNFVVVYKIINAEVWPAINALHVFAGERVSMYLPDFSYGQAVAAALFPLFPVLLAEFAYFLGTKDISLAQKLIYKKQKTPPAPKTTYEQYRERQKRVTPVAQKPVEKPSLLHRILYKDEDKKS